MALAKLELLEKQGCKVAPKSEQKWIPVSERLPEDGQKVVVTTQRANGIDVDTCLFYHASSFWKHFVIAWMPLPTSYQGESEDNKDRKV